MNQIEFNDEFRRRTRLLALEIIKIISPLKYSDGLGVLRKQLFKSSTSVAANFRAVCRARSEREKFAKLCIVVEEADETDFWLDMIVAAEFIPANTISHCIAEANEILSAMSAFKKRIAKDNNYNL